MRWFGEFSMRNRLITAVTKITARFAIGNGRKRSTSCCRNSSRCMFDESRASSCWPASKTDRYSGIFLAGSSERTTSGRLPDRISLTF
jgi:hypothetical protein